MRQAQALNVMLSGASVFLTGPPGAGKTYVLNEFVRRARRAHKTVAVTASTGIAATHIGGTTIHSWSGLGIKDYLSDWDRDRLKSNERLLKRYNSTDVLVIDEVSMLHGVRLDMVNEVCKLLRDSDEPFGGLQVVLVGDLFQLPPVSRGGPVDFVYESAAWAELDPKICYLSEQHRQSGGELLSILEAMRANQLEQFHADALQARIGIRPDASTAITRLYAHNIDVDDINTRHLRQLSGGVKTYTMRTQGARGKVEQLVKSVLAPEELTLKIGAEVMFVANDFAAGFVNGTRGQVVGFDDEGAPLVKLLNKAKIIKVEPHSWTLTEDDKKRAEVVQLPLRLAWAITIHKSQGMSLDAAEIDLTKTFTPGMGYVALSRVRSIDGLFLTGVNRMAMQLNPDIFEFDERLHHLSSALAAITDDVADEPVESDVESDTDYDAGLFEELRAWRLDRARRDQVAPFIIAHDTTLKAIAAKPPSDAKRLLTIPGFGPKKLSAYGDEILATISDYNAQNS